jgi:hypothetical protein
MPYRHWDTTTHGHWVSLLCLEARVMAGQTALGGLVSAGDVCAGRLWAQRTAGVATPYCVSAFHKGVN